MIEIQRVEFDPLFDGMLVGLAATGNAATFTTVAVKFDPDWLFPVSKADGKRYPSRLMRALQTAADCEQHIPDETKRLQRLLDEAQAKTKIFKEKKQPIPNEISIEIEARKYQIWYVKVYLERAARIAKERIQYLSEIKTEAIANAELERCRTDKQHWFRMYGWGYDPRARTPLSTVPFELHPRQEALVDWLDDIVFERRSSGIIEKARDEGATELMVRWGIHNWRFRDGFSMLLSSRTEDEVDTKKKQGTLFERARFQLRLLPEWMLPEGFDIEKDMLADKLIANPANNNQLMGQAPVENMGRGDRVTCAMFDEFAFWRFAGYPQYTSMSQTTDSILMPSSVSGRLNQYADIAFDGITPKFEMDWRDNPFKTKAWHDALPYGFISPKMTATAIAQEVDRNYDAAQPGKVWPNVNEPYTFISFSDFIRPFAAMGLTKQFFTKDGNFRIPPDWRITRTHDFGKSDGHEWAYLLGAQPREAYPLHDTHFIFLAKNLEPTGLSTEEAVSQWRQMEESLGIRKPTGEWIVKPHASWHSHEQKGLRKVLRQKFGETWIPWITDYHTGITQIEDWFRVVDKHLPNPFRPQLMGRSTVVFVAPDGEYQLAHNDRLDTDYVTMSTSEMAFATLRRQLSAYHYPQNELGKPVKEMRPVKEFDDIVDCLVAGTLVRTRRGEVPIETVTTADHVMTRQGWKPVTKAGKSADGVTVYTLTDAEGRQISGTGNHKIWTTNRGWVPLRGLTVSDKLLAWQNQNELNSTATPTFGTPTRPIKATEGTSIAGQARLFMLRYGGSIMGMFRVDTMSTIKTKTPSITTFPTLSLSLHPNIFPSTHVIVPELRSGANIVTPPSRRTLRGWAGSVLDYVRSVKATGLAWSRSRYRASSAAQSLQDPDSLRIESDLCTVQEIAVSGLTKNVKRVSVYNLNVAEAHEYFANGILVANCLRGYAVMWNQDPEPLTDDEQVEDAMPKGYKMHELQARSPHAKGLSDRQYVARAIMEAEVREKLGKPHQLPGWLQDAEEVEVVEADLKDGW